jgi:hypothetical protein
MKWTPVIVHSARTPCWPWRLREGKEPVISGKCATCNQDVAWPVGLQNYQPVCLSCAMDSGLLPAVEIDPQHDRTLHQLAYEDKQP